METIKTAEEQLLGVRLRSHKSKSFTLTFLKIEDFIHGVLPELLDACSPDTMAYRKAPPALIKSTPLLSSIYSEDELHKINNCKTMKKQIEWMCGRFCIKSLLSAHCGAALNSIVLAQEDEGAPFWPMMPETMFSITHSGDYAGAALHYSPNYVIGLDLEDIRRENLDSIMNIAFTKEEQYNANSRDEIFRIWTVKEAYLKYIRKGFHEALKSIEFVDDTLYHNHSRIDLSIQTKKLDTNHIFTVIC